jgi:hypothetical protein
MKLNLKKIRVNQLIVLLIAIVVALYLIRPISKPEKYEGDVGPSTGPSPQSEDTSKITKEDLAAVLKFIG